MTNQTPDPAAGQDHDALALRPIAECLEGDCPTVYVSDRNTVVVQGYAVLPERTGRVLPEGEALVEIPTDLLARAAQNVF